MTPSGDALPNSGRVIREPTRGTEMIRRAWNGFVADGLDRDRFANTVATRVNSEVEPAFGYDVEMVGNWVEIADRMFHDGQDANTCDIGELWEYVVWGDEGDE